MSWIQIKFCFVVPFIGSSTKPRASKYLRISILITAYNEQDAIVAVLERIETVTVPGVEFETIVIDERVHP